MTLSDPDRWEHGSESHWLAFSDHQPAQMPWDLSYVTYGSGRDALRALVSFGQLTRQWRRLHIPSYFCQEVIASLDTEDIDIVAYSSGPSSPVLVLDGIDWSPGDVILRVNYFGLGIERATAPIPDWVGVIEDHTHDPWSVWAYESNADWCISSLRKTLPLGNGGVLWSPSGHSLPPELAVTPERHVAALEKMAAMVLKTHYLASHSISKDVFRQLQLSGENHIASGSVSGMPKWAEALLSTFPIAYWRDCRLRNHRTLAKSLSGASWTKMLHPQPDVDACPFAGILVFDTRKRRDRVRERLIAEKIYPAVLWPLEKTVVAGVRREDIDFSERMLAIHCDMRYSDSDMQRVAAMILEFGELSS